MKIIISGGGSGGHVFPAIAIAEALTKKGINDILFVGAEDKIEMKKVPQAGFKIEGLWISGFHRGKILRNLAFPFKLISSLWKAKKIIDRFKPDVVVGVGGFASGPVLKVAQQKGIPTVIQEQNSYPGVTNKLLAGNADKILVAYKNMDKFFDTNKMQLCGNPIRENIQTHDFSQKGGYKKFGLDKDKKTILLFGGSLGARSLNEAVLAQLSMFQERDDIQLIWQVGSIYYDDFKNIKESDRVKIMPFIDDMVAAYSVADVIICRAGALTISELCIVGKPAIFVPSPNVAEDHQTMNAKALEKEDAAIIVNDRRAKEELIPRAFELLDDKETQQRLSQNISSLAIRNVSETIADEIIELARQ